MRVHEKRKLGEKTHTEQHVTAQLLLLALLALLVVVAAKMQMLSLLPVQLDLVVVIFLFFTNNIIANIFISTKLKTQAHYVFRHTYFDTHSYVYTPTTKSTKRNIKDHKKNEKVQNHQKKQQPNSSYTSTLNSAVTIF